jgi:hypothetical protein
MRRELEVSKGFFGDPDSVDRLMHALVGSAGHGGMAEVVREVRDQVTKTVGSLVPSVWSGDAASAFAQTLNNQDVSNLRAISEAATDLAAPLARLASDLRVANSRGEQAKQIASDVGFGFGFDIDSSGNTSDDWLHAIEQHIPGVVDSHLLSIARDEMLAARHIAENACDTARHALVNVQVPRIGSDTLHQAERWGFEQAALPGNIPGSNDRKGTGLPPTKPRPNSYVEGQRKGAMSMVQQCCARIVQVANQYGVPPEAIAGAILWEALENPHHSKPALLDPGPGPGKVHWYELPRTWNAAEHAEDQGKLPAVLPSVFGDAERKPRVTDPDGAIRYIGAILADDVDIYRNIAHVDISQNVGVLLTLYEGVRGGPETTAADLAAAREHDPSAQPGMGNAMGPWVMENLQWVKAQLPCL